MAPLKKISGNYVQVVDALGFPTQFYEKATTKKQYIDEIQRDLPRMRYINYGTNVEAMQKRLVDSRGIQDKDLSYAQGDFFGGFTLASISRYQASQYEETPETMYAKKADLSFFYTDDEGSACGFSIAYLIDPATATLFLSVCRIKHVNKAPREREVIFLSHPIFLLKKEVGKVVAGSTLQNEVEKALNCKSIQQLFSGLIKEGNIDLDCFEALDKRIRTNHNIDDRDPKLNKLLDLYVIKERLIAHNGASEEKNQLISELRTIINEAYQDVNYFKDKTLLHIEQMVDFYEKKPLVQSLPVNREVAVFKDRSIQIIARYNEKVCCNTANLQWQSSFWARNQSDLALTSIALLAVGSMLLIFTGCLAPWGITMAMGLATELAIAGTSIAGLVAIHRAFKIMNTEQEYLGKEAAQIAPK